MTVVLEADSLTKRFAGQDVVAVDGVDLRLQEGRVLALLGANGAGKTTTLRMLTTLTRPSSGSARIAGGGHQHRRF